MAQIETWLNQDMMQAVKVRYLDGNLFSQDNAGNLIGVKLTRDGEDYSGGGTVSANVIRADGGTVAVTGALSGNVATVVLPQSAYAVPGVVSIVVKLTVSGAIITIAAVVANIYQSSTETAIDPGTIIPSIQTLINQINTAVASIPADYSSLWETLAPAFSTSTSYTIGQYVTYDGGLYRFTSAHPAGAWSSSDTTAAVVGNVFTDLQTGKADKTDPVFYGTISKGRKGNSQAGTGSVALGDNVTANGWFSQAEGQGTIANGSYQRASGKYNVADTGNTYAEMVGNGYSEVDPQTFVVTEHRSNARTLDWNGNETLAGDLTVNKGTANEVTLGSEVSNLKNEVNSMPNRIRYDLSSISVSASYNNFALSGDGGYASSSGWKIEDYNLTALDVIYIKLKKANYANYEFHTSNTLSSSTLVGSTYNEYINDVISIPDTATHLFICFKTDDDEKDVKKAKNWVNGIDKKFEDENEKIQQINNDIRINYTQGDSISASATTNNFALNGIGGYVSKSGYVLYQYPVTAGEYIYIDVNEYQGCGAYEFHTASGALSADNLIGDPSLTGYDGYIKVPTGAGRIAITGTSSDVPTVKKATRSNGIDELFDDVDVLSKQTATIMYDLSDIDVAQTWSGMKLDGSGGWAWADGYTVKRYVISGMNNLYLTLKTCPNANYEFHSNNTLASNSLIGTAYNTEVDGLVSIPENATNLFVNYKNSDSYQVKSATNWRNKMEEQITDLYTSSGNGSSFASADSITASTMTVCEDFHLKKGFSIDFYGEFSTYANVEIGQGISAAQGRSIRITSTAIELYFGGGNGTTEKVLRKTENHGLTLADYIYAKIDVDRKSNIKVTLMSNGETVSKDMGSATGGSGNCEVYVSGTMTSAKGSLMAIDSFCDVFIFGDSYVNPFATSYTKHLLLNGYTKFLLSGIPGGTGQYEIDGFRTAVALHKPKVALWALGMNDAGASAWKTYADQFIDICEDKGITPVLATIPNVANKKDNTTLNEYVRESGHRYVDFAKAVGAESSDSTWYEGMLINNDIHPTDLGGIALMNMLFVDLPEIASAYDPNDVTD